MRYDVRLVLLGEGERTELFVGVVHRDVIEDALEVLRARPGSDGLDQVIQNRWGRISRRRRMAAGKETT